MDKLLMICKIFNVTLDDLTNDDISTRNMKEKNKGTINNFIYALLDMINKSVEMFRSMSGKEIRKCIREMLIVVLLLLICSIPFSYIDDLARNIFLNFGDKAYSIIFSIWCFFSSGIYLVLFVTVLIYVFKERYLDKFDYINIVKESNEVKVKNEEKEEKLDKEIINNQESKSNFVLFNCLAGVFSFLVKLCLIFIVIPLVLIFFGLVVTFFLALILIFKGVSYPGILIGILGCVIISYVVMEMAIRFLLGSKLGFKRIFITFVAGLIIGGCGFAFSTFELAETDYIMGVPSTEVTTSKNFNFKMSPDLFLSNTYYYNQNISYVIDDGLTDDVEVVVTYYNKFLDVNVSLENKQIIVSSWEAPFIFKNSYNLVMDNLKNKKIYDYSKLYCVDVVVKSSQNNINTLKDNYIKYWDDIERRELERENRRYYYQSKLDALTEENEILQEKIIEANETIEELQNKITNIESIFDN